MAPVRLVFWLHDLAKIVVTLVLHIGVQVCVLLQWPTPTKPLHKVGRCHCLRNRRELGNQTWGTNNEALRVYIIFQFINFQHTRLLSGSLRTPRNPTIYAALACLGGILDGYPL